MIAFVFPGQGSQKVEMGKELYDEFLVVQETFKEASDALGFDLAKLCFKGPADELNLTQNSQPAILTTSVAILRALQEFVGLNPLMVAGHSLGEFSALVCAGALDFSDAVKLVHKRGMYMQEAVPVGQGTMAAIMGVDYESVQEICKEAAKKQVLTPANLNYAGQIVISGHTEAVKRAKPLVKEAGGRFIGLKVSAPFHCSLMKPAAKKLNSDLKKVSFNNLQVPIVHNVDGNQNLDESLVVDKLTQQVTDAVLWEKSVRTMIEIGATHFYEIGFGNVLTGMLKKIDEDITVTTINSVKAIDELFYLKRKKEEFRRSTQPLGAFEILDSKIAKHKEENIVIWPDGHVDEVNEQCFHYLENGVKIKKWGCLGVVWDDGRLELLDPEEWMRLTNGSFMRKDKTSWLTWKGNVEDFDLKQWEILADGTMKKKDGTRMIWTDGEQWFAPTKDQ